MFTITPSQALAQDDDVESYWYISFYELTSYEKLDSLRNMLKRDHPGFIAEIADDDRILDEKVLFHHTGSKYHVVFMAHMPNWASLENREAFDIIWKEMMEGKEEESQKMQQTMSWIFEGSEHYDSIYQEAYDR